MPLDFKTFTTMLRGLPADASDEAVTTAAHVVEAGNPVQKVWDWANKPLVGGEDSPLLAHKHGPDEGFLRTTAEDLGAGLTSPLNLAVTATGIGGAMAGARGALGISQAARGAEAALQVPWALEGIKKVADGDSLGDVIGGALETGMATHGIGRATKHAFPPAKVVQTYMEEKGLQPQVREAFNPEAAKVTADNYEGMKHEPENPAVAKSYASLKGQVDEQYKFLAERAGVTIEPWTGKGEPYSGSRAMQEDIRKNNHLWFLPTEQSYGDSGGKSLFDPEVKSDHPMITETPLKMLPNDQFRAVHDYFGHASEGNTFSAKGEQEAFNAHRDTLTEDAHGALATETKGQNSWVNSGRHLRNPDGTLPQKGQPGWVPPTERPFAEQKAGLLPEYQAKAEREVLPQGDELARGVAGVSTPRIEPIDGALSNPAGSQPLAALSDELASQINESHQKGGSTTSLTGQKLLGESDGRYMLSPFEDRQLKLDHAPTPQDLRNYIAKNEDLLSKPGHNLGTWWNKDGDGKHYLDVSITENDPQKALELGRQHKQLAIYDMAEGKDIQVPSPAVEVHKDAELSNMRRNAPFGEGSIMPNSLRPSEFGNMGLAVASPAASAAIDDSDPNDPNYEVKHTLKIALDGLGAIGLGATVLKQIKSPVTLANTLATGQRALGKSPKQIVSFLRKNVPEIDDKLTVRALKFSEEKYAKILEATDGKFADMKHLRGLIREGADGKDWYAEGPMLKDELKTSGVISTPEDERVWKGLLGAMGSQNPPKGNYRDARALFEAWKDGQLKIQPDGSMALPDAWHPKTPGLNNVENILNQRELTGRKINSYGASLAGEGDALVADRHHARFHGFSPDSRPGLGDIDNPTYEAMEQLMKHKIAPKGWTVSEAQAAGWKGTKSRQANDVIKVAGPEAWKKPQQGYGMFQQHRLFEAEERLVNQDLVERVQTPAPTKQNPRAIEESLELTAKGKAEIAVPLKKLSMAVASNGVGLMKEGGVPVQAFPERTIRVPKGVAIRQEMLQSFYFDNADLLEHPNTTVFAIKNPKTGEHQLSVVALAANDTEAQRLVADLKLNSAGKPGPRSQGPTDAAGLGRPPHLYERLMRLGASVGAHDSVAKTGTDDIPF